VNLPIAHAGHWVADLIIFAPVVGGGIWMAVTGIRDRHRD
jgi:hypothetical protein